MARERQIIALGGGGFSMEESPLLDDYVLAATGVGRAKICFLPTASGDSDNLVVKFYRAFAGKADVDHLSLFRRSPGELRDVLLSQDAIYVGGGNTANMLAIWRLHGVDAALREAWQAGVVLAGVSAGAICWFESGVTDSFGPDLAPMTGCMGFLSGSFCPHYDGEERRRPVYESLVARGELAAGYAVDDGAALHFNGTSLARAVCSRPSAVAYRVRSRTDSIEVETLAMNYLGKRLE